MPRVKRSMRPTPRRSAVPKLRPVNVRSVAIARKAMRDPAPDPEREARAFLDGAAIPETVPFEHQGRYTEAIGRSICDLIMDGKTAREACDGRDGRPLSRSTLYRWLEGNQDFEAAYSKALRWRTQAFAEDVIEIVDSAPAIAADLKKAEMQAAERKWALARAFPRRYGDENVIGMDAIDVTPAAANNGGTQQAAVKTIEAHPLYEEVLAWDNAAAEAASPKRGA